MPRLNHNTLKHPPMRTIHLIHSARPTSGCICMGSCHLARCWSYPQKSDLKKKEKKRTKITMFYLTFVSLSYLSMVIWGLFICVYKYNQNRTRHIIISYLSLISVWFCNTGHSRGTHNFIIFFSLTNHKWWKLQVLGCVATACVMLSCHYGKCWCLNSCGSNGEFKSGK